MVLIKDIKFTLVLLNLDIFPFSVETDQLTMQDPLLCIQFIV